MASQAVELPPLSWRFDGRRAYYRLEFLDDGFPGREQDDGSITPHPMYGVYVLKDYLEQHHETPHPQFREAVRKVAHAAIDRMERLGDALVFWYDPAPTVAARLHTRHYSGLTQAYYAVVLHRAGKLLDDPAVQRAARRVAASLAVPADEGGVLFRDSHGLSFAEVPDEPNPYILNGWLSILVWLWKYATEAGSTRYAELVRDSTATLEELLPLYDVPELANSRYGLTGFQYARLRFQPNQRPVIRSVSLSRGGSALAPVPVRTASRWQNFIVADDVEETDQGPRPVERTLRCNLVLSLASGAAGNTLHVELAEPSEHPVALDLHVGRYEPLATAPVDGSWTEVGCRAPREGRLDFVLPGEETWLTAYPTNFKKRIDGAQVNVYHPLHVFRLRELSDQLDAPRVAQYATKWADYICSWRQRPLYDGLMVTDPSRRGHGPPSRWCGVATELDG